MSKTKPAKPTPNHKQQTVAQPLTKKRTKLADKLSRWIPLLGGVIFCVIALFQLIGLNSDYLFAVQEQSLFLEGWDFFAETFSVPGGVVAWMGCYLTQMFYYPALGSIILVALWMVCYAVMLRVFRIGRMWSPIMLIPLFALLASVTGLGYWLYYMKMEGYWFSETLMLLFILLGYGGYKTLNKRTKRAFIACLIYIALWTVFGYPLFGWNALLGALMMGVDEIVRGYRESGIKSVWIPSIYVAAVIGIVPLCWYYGFSQMRLADAWLCGFPLFEAGTYTSWIMSAPFIIVALAMVVFTTLSSYTETTRPTDNASENGTVKQLILSLLLVGLSAVMACQANVSDYNYHAELRMYRHTENGDWKEVMKEMRQWEGTPTRQMVMLKNIALMNTGNLGTHMFRFDNGGQYPFQRDSLVIHLTQTAAPMIYYQYGKFNYATRWAIENGVEYGFNVGSLKLLAKCALLNGEYDVAEKYISQLKKTTFHRQEAEKLEQFRQSPALMDKEPAFRVPKELNKHMGNTLDSDNGFCEMYILHNFSKTMNIDSKLLQEVTLSYALVSKDIQLFWPRFFQYATLHNGEEMPLHYQEAAYLYGNLEKNVNINNMPFDKEKVINRYAKFNQTVQGHLKRGLNTRQIGEICKASYGDTFWWFYFFCNDVSSY